MLKKSYELFNLLGINKICYIHWKGNEHLMEGLDGETDLDVLFSPAERESLYGILKKTGFVKFKSQYGSRYPNVEDWIGFDNVTGRLLHLHTHFALMTGHQGMKEYELPWTNEALLTRILNAESGVYIMKPELELVSLYTRLILKAKRNWIRAARQNQYNIDKHFSKEIEFIKKEVNWDSVIEIASRYYKSDAHEFVDIVRSDVLDSQQFLRLFTIVTQRMSSQSRYHGMSLALRRAYFPIIVTIRRILRERNGWNIITRKVANPHNGFSIALIGQDGCGKSTVTMEIEKWLNWKIEARRFYLGSGDHYNGMLKRLIRKGAKIKRNNEDKKGSSDVSSKSGSNQKRKKNLKNFLSALLVAMNMLTVVRRAYKVIVKSFKYQNNGGIALYDRFPQSQFEGIYDGPKIAAYCQQTGLDFSILKWMAKLEKKYIDKIQEYQPKIVFKLILPPEESIRRKPFENFDAVARKHDITKKLVFETSDIYIVDATQDFQEELIFIKNIIWKEIQNIKSL